MYPGWQIPQNVSSMRRYFLDGGGDETPFARENTRGEMVKMRTFEAKMVEARMAGDLS